MNKLLTTFKNQKRLVFIIFATFLIQFLMSIIIIFMASMHQVQVQLDQKIHQVKVDVQLKNDVWDLSLYNNDPKLLGTYPLYFIALDGFVIDRRSPIHGFLDTSDFKRLLSYEIPQTIKSASGQSRRIYVRPIIYKNKPVAVLALSYFDPPKELLDQIDSKLNTAADDISTQISFNQGVIDTSKLDARRIHHNISFTIVDAYNSILIRTTNVNSIDRIPNFIDPSYVKNTISSRPMRIVRDSQTNELFLVRSSTFYKDSNPTAVLVIGQSINPILDLLISYSIIEGIFGLLVVFLAACILLFRKTSKKGGIEKNPVVKKVVFNEKNGMLVVDGVAIEIPYATNQFYLLQMLFSHPSKRLETDELLERFGEHISPNNNRKVYDAMTSINKKVLKIIPLKLIINQNKTYQLNPKVLITK